MGIRKFIAILCLITMGLLIVLSQSIVFASNSTTTSINNSSGIIVEKYTGIIPANLLPSSLNINRSYYNDSLKAYVDPVLAQVTDMRAKGISDDIIVTELKNQNIIFDPKTNEWARGTLMTPPVIYNPYNNTVIYPNDKNSLQNGPQLLTDDRGQINSYHNTNYYTYCGFSNTVYPGNMELYGDGYTYTNYITTHIGDGSHWTEAGIAHWDSGYYVYTYDNTFPPGYQYVTIPTTVGVSHTLSIYISTIYDSGHGYVYYVFMDGNYERSGHLSSITFQVTQNNEVFKKSTDPSFTNNAYSNQVWNQHLYWYDPWLNRQDILWSTGVSTNNGDGGYPSHQVVSTDSSGSAQVNTWIHY